MNKFIFTGRLTADPELKLFEWGNVSNFSLAVDRGYKNAKGEKMTDFFNLQAKKEHIVKIITQYLTKGSLVLVEGNIYTRKYADKDGNNKIATDYIVNEVNFLSKPKKEEQNTPF